MGTLLEHDGIDDYDIEWLQWFDPQATSDLFYCEGYHHSPVCIVKGNGRHILIACDGEMTIRYNDNVIKDFWDLEENGIKTDLDLSKLDPDNFDDNPWLDAYDVTVNYDEVAGVETYDNLDMVSGTIEEIIEKVKIYLKENK